MVREHYTDWLPEFHPIAGTAALGSATIHALLAAGACFARPNARLVSSLKIVDVY